MFYVILIFLCLMRMLPFIAFAVAAGVFGSSLGVVIGLRNRSSLLGGMAVIVFFFWGVFVGGVLAYAGWNEGGLRWFGWNREELFFISGLLLALAMLILFVSLVCGLLRGSGVGKFKKNDTIVKKHSVKKQPVATANGNIQATPGEKTSQGKPSRRKPWMTALPCLLLVVGTWFLISGVTGKNSHVKEKQVKIALKIDPSSKGMTSEDGAVFPEPLEKTHRNSIGMEFVLVGKGQAWLGGGGGQPGEKSQIIEKGFYLGKYEVTQEEWKSVTGVNPSFFSSEGANKEAVKNIKEEELKRFPMENVTWDDCQWFIRLLNQKEAGTGWVYRLPTEAEWEYACRGGASQQVMSSFSYYFAKPTNVVLQEQANIEWGKGLKRTCKVGSYEPNSLGLYDMHGNVWEWCDDSQKANDGSLLRVYRGGAWDGFFGNPGGTAARDANPPSFQNGLLGLRLAAVPTKIGNMTFAPGTEKAPAINPITNLPEPPAKK